LEGQGRQRQEREVPKGLGAKGNEGSRASSRRPRGASATSSSRMPSRPRSPSPPSKPRGECHRPVARYGHGRCGEHLGGRCLTTCASRSSTHLALRRIRSRASPTSSSTRTRLTWPRERRWRSSSGGPSTTGSSWHPLSTTPLFRRGREPRRGEAQSAPRRTDASLVGAAGRNGACNGQMPSTPGARSSRRRGSCRGWDSPRRTGGSALPLADRGLRCGHRPGARAMAIQMTRASMLSLNHFGLGFLTTSEWILPRALGALAYVFGTVASSLVALLVAIPVALGSRSSSRSSRRSG